MAHDSVLLVKSWHGAFKGEEEAAAASEVGFSYLFLE